MFCAFTRPRYQLSVYRTIGPLVLILKYMYSINFMLICIEQEKHK